MKFTAVFVLFTIVSMCSAQDTEPVRPNIGILPAEEGCAPIDVLNITKCGCFITLFGDPVNREIRDECRNVTGTAVADSQAACDPFLIEYNTTYNFSGIIDTVNDVKTRCFGDAFTRSDLLANIQISLFVLTRAEQFFDLLNRLSDIFH